MVEKFARRDAAVDGWSSEVLRETTGSPFRALGMWLAKPGALECAPLTGLLAEDYACTELRPECEAVEGVSAALKLKRNDAPAKKPVHVDAEGARRAAKRRAGRSARATCPPAICARCAALRQRARR